MLGNRITESGELIDETWIPIYYPGTTDIRTARQIDLSPGEHFNANLSVAASPTRTLQIKGIALDPTGKPLESGEVTLSLRKTDGHSVVLPTARIAIDGAFTLRGVVPGSYMMFVTGQLTPNSEPFVGPVPARPVADDPCAVITCGTMATAAFPIEVGNADISDLKIPTVPAINIPWRVAFEPPAASTKDT